MDFGAPAIIGSPQQKEIWAAIRSSKKNILIEARAGTGKTFTLVEALKRLVNPGAVCFAAFGKAIERELSRKVPRGMSTRTLHSLGYKVLRDNSSKDIELNHDRTYNIVNDVKVDHGYDRLPSGVHPTIQKVVSRCKAEGYNPFDDSDSRLSHFEEVLDHYGIELEERWWDMTMQVLEVSAKDDPFEIDYDDMVWLPIILNLKASFRFNLMLVDESQDLTLLQQELAFRLADRLVFVGDRYQSIYGFRGADSEAIPNLIERLKGHPLKLETFPLTVCRRCDLAMIEMAQELVPDIQPMDGKEPGTIDTGYESDLAEVCEAGDMIISRVNLPLIRAIYQIWKHKKKAFIEGRDVGEDFRRLIKRLNPGSLPELITMVDDHEQNMQAKFEGRRNAASRIAKLRDECDCLRFFAEQEDNLTTLDTTLTEMFADRGENRITDSVRLSSIHRAKGLEADHVRLLAPELIPHPMAQQPWELQQEFNAGYVAVTRPIHHLTCYSSIPPCFPKFTIKDSADARRSKPAKPKAVARAKPSSKTAAKPAKRATALDKRAKGRKGSGRKPGRR